MTSFVDVSDAGAAEAAAQRIIAAGERLNDGAMPPEVEWGDDKFGEAMRSAYFKAQDNGLSPHFACIQEKSKLGKALGETGGGVTKALAELSGQETDNKLRLDRITPPNV